jgi:hypothetical protein
MSLQIHLLTYYFVFSLRIEYIIVWIGVVQFFLLKETFGLDSSKYFQVQEPSRLIQKSNPIQYAFYTFLNVRN